MPVLDPPAEASKIERKRHGGNHTVHREERRRIRFLLRRNSCVLWEKRESSLREIQPRKCRMYHDAELVPKFRARVVVSFRAAPGGAPWKNSSCGVGAPSM